MISIDSPIYDGSIDCSFCGEPGWMFSQLPQDYCAGVELIGTKTPKIDNNEITDIFWDEF